MVTAVCITGIMAATRVLDIIPTVAFIMVITIHIIHTVTTVMTTAIPESPGENGTAH